MTMMYMQKKNWFHWVVILTPIMRLIKSILNKVRNYFTGPTQYAERLALYQWHNGKTCVWRAENSCMLFITRFRIVDGKPQLLKYRLSSIIVDGETIYDISLYGVYDSLHTLDRYTLLMYSCMEIDLKALVDFIGRYEKVKFIFNPHQKRKVMYFAKTKKLPYRYWVTSRLTEVVTANGDPKSVRLAHHQVKPFYYHPIGK